MKLLPIVLIAMFSQHIIGQNAKIISKQLIDYRKSAVWPTIADNDTLKTSFAHLKDINIYKIEYLSDSIVVQGYYMEPKKEGTYPVIIFNRGGNLDFSPLSPSTMIMYNSHLASRGYIVIGSNYRTDDEFGGKDVNDVLNLIDLAENLPKAERNSIGMFGWSRGGMMTYLALKKRHKVKTAVIGNGPVDLVQLAGKRPAFEKKVLANCIPDYYAKRTQNLMDRSVMYWPEKLNSETSLLILSGTQDKRVDPARTRTLAKKLKRLRYNVVLKEVETDHYFSDKKAVLYQTLITWFDENL